MREPLLAKRIAGVVLVLTVVFSTFLTIALYNHAFANPVEVTVKTTRTGLVMDPGNKVKMRGIDIGRVSEVRAVGDGAELVLELDPDQREMIPANATAVIKSTTVFGAKYVELVAPGAPVAARVSDGAVIDGTAITTELNTVFKSLRRVLDGINVADLNTTMTVLARTLEGRGDDFAQMAAQADAYLTKLEPLLPQVRRDLRQLARLAELGNAVSPALLKILEHATVTSHTIATERQALDRLLVDLSILGDQGAKVLGVNSTALANLLRSMRPTTETLAAYSSELPCLFKGLDRSRKLIGDALGGVSPGLRAYFGLRSGLEPYRAPTDLPKVPRGWGADCAGLPFLKPNQRPPVRGSE